jgi:GNAT superfamily N-acetyltransferase
MQITFQKPALDDAETLLDIQIRSFHSDAQLYPGVAEGGPPGYDSLDEVLNDMRRYPMVKILCDGQIVGGMVVIDHGGGHVHLGRIFIDPEYHNRGIGSASMHYLEQTWPATRYTLDTPAYAVRNHHFYEKFGFVRVGESHVDDIVLLEYEKRL